MAPVIVGHMLFHPHNLFLSLFFFVMAVGLFLGDEKQSIIDIVFWGFIVASAVLLRSVSYLNKTSDRLLRLFFISTIVGFLISLIFSDSVGLSLFSFLRLLSGISVFYVFYSISSTRVFLMYQRYLVGFILFAIFSSLIASVTDRVDEFLPRMNLLVANYGHSHLADLLIIIIPLLSIRFVSKPEVKSGLLLFLLFISLFFTFARGAWIPLLFFYVSYGVRQKILKRHYLLPLLTSLIIFIFIVSTFVMSLNKTDPGYSTTGTVSDKIVKSSPLIDQRIRYWKQAITVIKERVFVGNGPGTFSIASRRLQEKLNAYSWFAHSFVLQSFAELGVVGALPLFATIGYIAYVLLKKYFFDDTYFGFLSGHLLVLVYGLYEFNLDFLIVWILFWSGLGLLMGIGRDNNSKKSPAELRVIYVTLAGAYLFGVISLALSFNSRASFYLFPHSQINTLVYLEELKTKKISALDESMVMIFHKKNPPVLYAMGKAYEASGNINKATYYYHEAIIVDPQNGSYVSKYMMLLFKHRTPKEISTRFIDLLRNIDVDEKNHSLFLISELDEQLALVIQEVYNETGFNWRESYTGVLYVLGLKLVESYPKTTEQLWLFARDIYPDVGFIHVELVRLYRHVFSDEQKAIKIIEDCVRLASPKKQCEDESSQISIPPGDFIDLFR